jgi:hypothetical protein
MQKYTTVALKSNQYLICQNPFVSIVEAYMIGFTNNKRDKNLDGYYFKNELNKQTNEKSI